MASNLYVLLEQEMESLDEPRKYRICTCIQCFEWKQCIYNVVWLWPSLWLAQPTGNNYDNRAWQTLLLPVSMTCFTLHLTWLLSRSHFSLCTMGEIGLIMGGADTGKGPLRNNNNNNNRGEDNFRVCSKVPFTLVVSHICPKFDNFNIPNIFPTSIISTMHAKIPPTTPPPGFHKLNNKRSYHLGYVVRFLQFLQYWCHLVWPTFLCHFLLHYI